ADRRHHRHGHVCARRLRRVGARGRLHALRRRARGSRPRRGRPRDPARRAPRRRPPPALEPGRPPREHRRARRARSRGGARRHRLRRRRPERRARIADRLRRPPLSGQPPARRLAVLLLLGGRRSAPRTLDLRGPVLRGAALDARHRSAGGRPDPPCRGLLRPRRRPPLQHARGDPRPRRLRRDGGESDRGPRGGPVRRGRAALRAARLRDRLCERRQGRGHARRRPPGPDRTQHRGLLLGPGGHTAGPRSSRRGARGRGLPLREL
ncbi:MAG: 5'-methylthioadenosine phosphorylase, partial [uncultured Solirubrobacterales bacterium]